MNFRIIYLPPFKAVTSGVDVNFDFSPEGILGKFDSYFSKISPEPKDCFRPRDFLFYDPIKKGLEWWWALSDNMDDGGYHTVNFEGGNYLVYNYQDGDEEKADILYKEAMQYIKDSKIFELDERPNHYTMAHIITPKDVIKAQGWAVMETFIPVKLIDNEHK